MSNTNEDDDSNNDKNGMENSRLEYKSKIEKV